ncbi:MAG: hypothetical protein ACYCT7_01065 [bacterium]
MNTINTSTNGQEINSVLHSVNQYGNNMIAKNINSSNVNNVSNTAGASDNKNIQNNIGSGRNNLNNKETINKNPENLQNGEKKISDQISKNINLSPMLTTAYILKWNGTYNGTVLNIIDLKTGKVTGTIPPSEVLKYIKNYQKGMLYKKEI